MLKKKIITIFITLSIIAAAAPVMAEEQAASSDAETVLYAQILSELGENELPMILDGGGKAALPFKDVARGAWYYDVIKQAYNMSLIKGMSNTEFAPDSSVTGAQLITMLYRAAGNTTSNDYSGNWYDETVSWAKENSIITADNGWDFNPEAELTREQMMVLLHKYMIYNGLGSSETADLTKFSDSSDISAWAADSIGWLVAKGYIVGDGETLRPKANLTRAETATILVRSVSGGSN